jgi:hypothetical protein
VMARIRDEFEVSLTLRAIFDAPTVVELAVATDDAQSSSSAAPTPPPLVRVRRSAGSDRSRL